MLKRKRIVLSINEKLQIIGRLKKGESANALASEFNVGKSTIADIRKSELMLTSYSDQLESMDGQGNSFRKTMKTAENFKLDCALYKWFVQERRKGQPIPGSTICEKALTMNKKIGGNPRFKASTGWLHKFKSRHGILRQHDNSSESNSQNFESVDNFKRQLSLIIKEKGYDNENIYNANETGLNWKILSKTTEASAETTAFECKGNNERITIMMCANATGSHRLKLTVIGKSKYPTCFKNVNMNNFPVTYLHQKNACMDVDNFTKWFNDVFVSSARKWKAKLNVKGPILLLLDHSPAHPPVESLPRYDDVDVMYIPCNLISTLQPMNQSIIETFKRLYRKSFLMQYAVFNENDLMKEFNLKESAYIMADAWDRIQTDTLKRAWEKVSNKILNEGWNCDDERKETENCIKEEVNECLKVDETDPGYQLLTDEEIVWSLNERIKPEPDSSDEDDNENTVNTTPPTAEEAFDAIATVLKWAEAENDIDCVQLMNLKTLQVVAARKMGCRGLIADCDNKVLKME